LTTRQAKQTISEHRDLEIRRQIYGGGAFARLDEGDDRVFYEVDRTVQHLDRSALDTVTAIIESLVVEARPRVLDLMASWDSHLPACLEPQQVVGLGLNRRELAANHRLDQRIVHDLNKDPHLPFPEAFFDVVINTVSVDYLIKPFAVVAEVARILRPGGLFLVIFSNRFFPEKVVHVWRTASEAERVFIVQDYLRSSPLMTPPQDFASLGRPRPEGDRYDGLGLPSDPVFAVWAERTGAPINRPHRHPPVIDSPELPKAEILEARQSAVASSLICPYCNESLRKWSVPQTPFTEWDAAFMYICFNDRCPYVVRGWDAMERQGNRGMSYRLMYNPANDRCTPVPVPSLNALRDGIVDDRR
jgi:SAM-dependent methyltransferase